MKKDIVLDIETQNSFQDVGGYFLDKLKISLIGVYFYETDEYRCFLEDEFQELWTRLEHGDRIIGYNSKGFDLPVMNSYYAGDFLKFQNLDIMEEITKFLGYRIKLDDVASATLGYGKTGHGLQAIEFWRKGEIDKLKDYCLQDVKVTKEVYDYGLEHGKIYYHDRSGQKREVPVDFKVREETGGGAINLTMPL